MAQPTQRSPVIPLAYQSPVPRTPGSWGIWVAYFLLWSVVAMMLTTGCLFIVPKFERIFADFKVQLPDATRLLIAFSRWFQQYGWAIVWLMAFGFAFAMAAATWRSPAPWRMFRIAHRLLWVLAGLLIAFGAWALYAPMLNLVTAVSGK